MLVASVFATDMTYLVTLAKTPVGSRLIEDFLQCKSHKYGKGQAASVSAAKLQKFIGRWTTVPKVTLGSKQSTQLGVDESRPIDQSVESTGGESSVQKKKKKRRGRTRDDPQPSGNDTSGGFLEQSTESATPAPGIPPPIVKLASDKFGSRVVEALYVR